MIPLVGLCQFALTYRRKLPDFICEQTTTSVGQQISKRMNAEVTFEKGHEHYSNITIDDKPPTDEAARAMKLVSTGELGSNLVDLFKELLTAEFKFRGKEEVDKTSALVYELHLAAKKNTFWALRDSWGTTLHPEYEGELWLERETGRLLRLELRPVHLPRDFDIISATITTDYNDILIADAGRLMLPSKSVTTACFHSPEPGDSFCRKNVLLFHDCRKFGTKSRVITDPVQH